MLRLQKQNYSASNNTLSWDVSGQNTARYTLYQKSLDGASSTFSTLINNKGIRFTKNIYLLQ